MMSMLRSVLTACCLFGVLSLSFGQTWSIGTDNTSNTAGQYPAPYARQNKGQKVQMIYTAAELSAVGMTAGPIHQIGWQVQQLNNINPISNFEIRMKHTTTSAFLNTSVWVTDAKLVYKATSEMVNTGWNMRVLREPFEWDGVSNIMVEITSFSNTSANNARCNFTVQAANRTMFYTANTVPLGGFEGYAGAATGVSVRRPNVRFLRSPVEYINLCYGDNQPLLDHDCPVGAIKKWYRNGAVINDENCDRIFASLTEGTTYYTSVCLNSNSQVVNSKVFVVNTSFPSISCPEVSITCATPGIVGTLVHIEPTVEACNDFSSTELKLTGATNLITSEDEAVLNPGVTQVECRLLVHNLFYQSCSYTYTVISQPEDASITLSEYAPVITSCGNNPHMVLPIGECSMATPTLSELEVIDNCSSAGVPYSITNNAAANYEVGTHNIVFTVTDVDGNSATCVQELVIEAADEVCNGLDDNCNGTVDEGVSLVCATPGQVSATNITQTSAKLGWAGSNCAVGYRIMYKKNTASAWLYQLTTSTDYTLTGLLPSSTYFSRVRSSCPGGGVSQWSAQRNFTTLAGLGTTVGNEAEAISTGRMEMETTAEIYPNPNGGQFRIYVPATAESRYHITVSDMTGRTCYKADTLTANGALDHTVALDHPVAGLYIIRLEGDHDTLTTFAIVGQ